MACRKHMQEGRKPESTNEELLQLFTETCEHFKPVLHIWYLEQFPSPQEWHRARRSYAKSMAVNSMVGHVVGIGDRHTNNILLDLRSGEAVHIDFGVVFDQGRALRIPE